MSMPPAAPFSTSTLLLATANDMLFPQRQERALLSNIKKSKASKQS
jgi:homoserine acetyltransferase